MSSSKGLGSLGCVEKKIHRRGNPEINRDEQKQNTHGREYQINPISTPLCNAYSITVTGFECKYYPLVNHWKGRGVEGIGSTAFIITR